MVRLNREMQDRIAFTRFCDVHGLEAADVAELVTLARRAFRAGERAAGGTIHTEERDKRAEVKAGDAFERKALALGFSVHWPGLWPTITRGGYETALPL